MARLPAIPTASKRPILMVIGILLIAMNLRAPFTSIAPLLEELRNRYALGAGQAGLLITLPLLAFAAVSPFAAGLARRCGIERTLFGALAVIAAGLLLRAAGGVAPLYAGTVIIGAGIALGNVLLPSLLKRDFPAQAASLTALYVLSMGVAAAASSAIVIPLSHALHADWRLVSRLPLLLTALAALLWLPQLPRRQPPGPQPAAASQPHDAVWRAPIAWQVTAYLGLDCLLYYVGVSWLPSILRDTAAYSTAEAASLHGVLLLATALPGLVLIPLAPRLRDQRAPACLLACSMVVGLLGFVLAPVHALIWIVLFGVGAGGGLVLALALIGLRTANAGGAAALSGMAQCIGYFFAAAGPPLIGKAHQATGGWNAPLSLCACLGVLMAIVGLYAGRNLQIGARQGHSCAPAVPAGTLPQRR
ncbi:MFS transporter [Janthinobacterium agaricidamnosum]|uniref:Major Facilitator Superfamily protein n=1 Tax=Janthinobacterium agaricidamnosum NBRC 102515 = DSM 9628 TaxID=1349767 RepID=W0V4M4_9BURK|nr:MFS transporter [Janthinobacterium agaricidamnosum]CDG82530.1 major Facilitator Superfamily protein [Janthinobacterium agaricidamnosum NBRC 102515 = DSM 9628]